MEYTDKIVNEAKMNINKTDFFKKRGYSLSLIKKYNLGYLYNGMASFSEEINEDPDILKCYKYIIPDYNKYGKVNYLIARCDSETMKKVLNFEIDKNYMVGNCKQSLWNCKALISDEPVFICETWTDALSVIDCGFKAIALNRIVNIVSLWKEIKQKKSAAKNYILFCDNDYYGKKSNDNLKRMLEGEGCKTAAVNGFPQGVKDANEWFIFDKESFCEKLRSKVYELY